MLVETTRGIGDNGGPQLNDQFTDPQFELITTNKRYPAMVAGFGAGKTEALVKRCLLYKFKYPEVNSAYYLPTYDLVTTIAFPRFEEALAEYGLVEGEDFKVTRSQTPNINIFGYGKIIFRTMDRPGRIVGYEVGDSFVDELDTLKEADAKAVWQKIISRNRQKKANGDANTVAVGTTPEGFRFVYQQWKNKPPSDEYAIIKASTYSNARNLPDDYIDDLKNDYPENLIMAYIEGDFVNLTSGSVYPEFDRELNNCDDQHKKGETVHIGMDFNVGKMAAVVFVYRNSLPCAVYEFKDLLDTPAMILAIKSKYNGCQVFVYPDASGNARKSNNASQSDLSLLREAGFNIKVNNKNPFVRDRVISMNVMINGGGIRKLKVNVNQCPSFTESLEKQAYDDKGEPDKTGDFDHLTDAGGYFICYNFPVVNRKIVKSKISGR